MSALSQRRLLLVGCLVGCVVALLFLIQSSFADGSSELPVNVPGTMSISEQVDAALRPTNDDPREARQIILPSAASHLHIRYSASEPIAIDVVPLDPASQVKFDPIELVFAVLPAGQNQDVLISLMGSPGWRRDRSGYVLHTYQRQHAVYEVDSIAMEDRSTVFSRFVSMLSHPFQRQYLAYSSINWLRGYEVAGTPFTLILFTIIVLVAGSMAMWVWLRDAKVHTPRLIATVLGCLVVGIMAYEARFCADLLGALFKEINSWNTIGGYTEEMGGDAYAFIDRYRSSAASGSVTICSDDPTFQSKALTYFLYPVPVDVAANNWATARYGALFGTNWDEQDGTILCRGLSRRGEVLELLPHDGAFVRFAN